MAVFEGGITVNSMAKEEDKRDRIMHRRGHQRIIPLNVDMFVYKAQIMVPYFTQSLCDYASSKSDHKLLSKALIKSIKMLKIIFESKYCRAREQ